MGCCPSKDAALLEVSHVETVQVGTSWQGGARRDNNASCASAAWLSLGGIQLEPLLLDDPAHGGAPIRLVDGRYLIRLADSGGRMARRQDCPDSAFLTLDNLRSLDMGGGNSLRIVAISHAWMQPDHPDPRGDNLRLIAAVLRLYINHSNPHGEAATAPPACTYAVMIDFMSAHQEGAEGEPRGESEAGLFRRALDGMGDWYSHPETIVLKLTNLPQAYPMGFTFAPDCVPNTAAYHERGWCFEESSVAGLAKSSSSKVVDLALFTETTVSLLELKNRCKAAQPPLLVPQAFAARLEAKSFASRQADIAHVRALYEHAFLKRLGEAKQLWYRELQWDDEAAAALVAVMEMGVLRSLEVLVLDSNDIGDVGASALASAICAGHMPHLTHIGLIDNPRISAKGIDALVGACAPRLIRCDVGGWDSIPASDLETPRAASGGAVGVSPVRRPSFTAFAALPNAVLGSGTPPPQGAANNSNPAVDDEARFYTLSM